MTRLLGMMLFFAVCLSATARAEFEIRPASHDFGSIQVDESDSQDFRITNVGSSRLPVNGIGLEGNGPFRILGNNCPASLRSDRSCVVTVAFEPRRAGTWTGSLVVTSSQSSRKAAALAGTGSARPAPQPPPAQPPPAQPPTVEPPAAPDLSLSRTSLDFGPVLVNGEQGRPLVIRNEGTSPLQIGTIGAVDPVALPFSLQEDGCSNRQIAPGASCRVTVLFRPLLTRNYEDAFDLPTNGGGSSRITVRGEGVGNAVAAIYVQEKTGVEDDLELPFGELLLGRSIESLIVVRNLGSANLNLTGIAVTDGLQPPFLLRGDSCSGKVLEPGGECSFRVRFRPLEAGAFSDTFELTSDDPRFQNLPLTVRGTGTVVAGNVPPAAPQLIHPDPDQANLRDNVTFRWSRCDDPDGDAVGYQLYLSTTADFTQADPVPVGISETAQMAGLGLAGLLAVAGAAGRRRRTYLLMFSLLLALLAACGDEIEDNATVEVGNLQEQTTYFWKVSADDGRGGLADSEVRTFTTR